MKIKPFLLIVVLLLIIAVAGLMLMRSQPLNPLDLDDDQKVSVTIGNDKIQATAAVSDQRRERGLSGIEKLDTDQGMLFVFDQPDRWSFWMKDTLIPLDVVWIFDNKIVDIQSMTVEGNPSEPTRNYLPKTDADLALEVVAGTAKNWQIGGSISISR